MLEYHAASSERKKELELRYGKKQMLRLVENIMSEEWIKDNSQKCPHCDVAIEVIKINKILKKLSFIIKNF